MATGDINNKSYQFKNRMVLLLFWGCFVVRAPQTACVDCCNYRVMLRRARYGAGDLRTRGPANGYFADYNLWTADLRTYLL